MVGDTLKYRTTIAANDGPARQINEIAWAAQARVSCYGGSWQVPRSGTVTYTNDAGERVTEPTHSQNGYDALGSWTVDPADGTTVVHDLVVTLVDPSAGPSVGCRSTALEQTADTGAYGINLFTALTIGVDGLDDFGWSPTGVTASCVLACKLPGLTGLGAGFGS